MAVTNHTLVPSQRDHLQTDTHVKGQHQPRDKFGQVPFWCVFQRMDEKSLLFPTCPDVTVAREHVLLKKSSVSKRNGLARKRKQGIETWLLVCLITTHCVTLGKAPHPSEHWCGNRCNAILSNRNTTIHFECRTASFSAAEWPCESDTKAGTYS